MCRHPQSHNLAFHSHFRLNTIRADCAIFDRWLASILLDARAVRRRATPSLFACALLVSIRWRPRRMDTFASTVGSVINSHIGFSCSMPCGYSSCRRACFFQLLNRSLSSPRLCFIARSLCAIRLGNSLSTSRIRFREKGSSRRDGKRS